MPPTPPRPINDKILFGDFVCIFLLEFRASPDPSLLRNQILHCWAIFNDFDLRDFDSWARSFFRKTARSTLDRLVQDKLILTNSDAGSEERYQLHGGREAFTRVRVIEQIRLMRDCEYSNKINQTIEKAHSLGIIKFEAF